MVRRSAAGANQGNPEARQIADEALGAFADVFGPFAVDRYGAAYGPTWRKDRGFYDGIGAQVHAIGDPQELLGRLQVGPEFERVFRPAIRIAPGTVFGLARDLKEHRNDLYHRTRPWEAADSWRLVDRVAALLGAFDLLAGNTREQLESLAQQSASIVAGDRSAEFDQLRREYVESTLSRTTHVDAGGINARVGSRVVQVRLEDVYVEPTLIAADDETEDADALSALDLLLTRRAVVLGGPGAGKSTLVRRLARMLAVGGETGVPTATPMIVIASEFAETVRMEPEISLRRYLSTRLSPRFGSFFAEEIELGRATVLIDGLDEVGEESLRSRIATLAGQFTHEYPNVGLIATARLVGYRPPASWASFAELKIASFNDDQIADFVERWAAILKEPDTDESDARTLVEDIAASDGVRELAGTPLLLTILVLLWHRGTRLPQRLSELYDLATTTLLRDWPARRLGHSFDDRRMLALLQPIALNLVGTGGATVSESDLLTRWGGAFAELEGVASPSDARNRAQAVLRLIEEHTGFFVEVGREAGERRYGFLHKTFAEYLAARELAEQWDAGNLDLTNYVHVNRWQQVVEQFVGHVGLRGQAAASRLVETILGLDPPSERYLRRNVALVVGFIAKGLQVRPDLRDEVVRRAIDQVLDPALEPLRTGRGVALANLARRLPITVSDAHAAPDPSDSPARRARKLWLRLLIRPDSDDRLGDFLQSIPDLLSDAVEGEADVQYAMRAIGVAGADERDGAGLFLRIGGMWFVPGEEAAERLSRIGIPRYEISEIVRSPALVADTSDPWLVDAESFEAATVGDIVALLGRDDAFWPIVYTVIDDADWQDARVAEIDGLTERVEELPREIASYALAAFDVLEPGPARDAWMKVLLAVIAGGETVARQLALVQYLTSPFGSMEGAPEIIAVAVDGDPVSARAVPIALAMQGGGAEPAIVKITEAMAINHPDPVARGLARRALAVTVQIDEPLKILSSPDVAVPSDTMLGPQTDTTGDVLSILLLQSGSDEAQATAAQIARRIIEMGSYVDYDLGGGDRYSNVAFDRLARDAAHSARPETRAWAARILGSLDRGPAPLELATLLTDSDATVRAVAIEAIQEVDLRQTTWIEDTILAFFGLEAGEEAEYLPVFMTRSLPPAVLEDLTSLTEAYLDDHPGNPGALFLLDSARSAGNVGTVR